LFCDANDLSFFCIAFPLFAPFVYTMTCVENSFFVITILLKNCFRRN